MKWMIASDIHGSAYYCKKVVESFKTEKADRLILLGDILYHGPRNALPRDYDPKTVAELLNGMKDHILAVRGNCDSEVDQMVLEFPMMADYAILDAGKKLVFITHGHLFDIEHLPPMREGDILLHGHTHVQRCVEASGVVYLNPGSTSIPKEDSQNGYMTFENGVFLWKNFDGQTFMEYKI